MKKQEAQKTQVLCTIPLPMSADLFVEINKRLTVAFKGWDVCIRNGEGCYEIFRRVDADDEYPPEPMSG